MHFQSWANVDDVSAAITLRLHNDKKAGLGIPLPAGTTTLYEPREGTRLLLGTGTIGDTAKLEHALLTAGLSPQVRASQNGDGRDREIVLSNANPFPVPVEVAIGTAGDDLFKDATAPLERVDGIQTWRLTCPRIVKLNSIIRLPGDSTGLGFSPRLAVYKSTVRTVDCRAAIAISV